MKLRKYCYNVQLKSQLRKQTKNQNEKQKENNYMIKVPRKDIEAKQ